MAGYHSALAIHPGTSYGISVLMTGHYADAAKIAYDAFEIFQPSIDQVLAERALLLYGGEWSTADGKSTTLRPVWKVNCDDVYPCMQS